MYVNDLERTKGFFVKYLDGKASDVYHNQRTDFRSYFISFDDGARLEIMTKPSLEDTEKNDKPHRLNSHSFFRREQGTG